MNWPPASDYQDAIQNPWHCFQEAELKGGQPALNRLGLPRVASGNFASVYQIHKAAERWAVRCFLRQGADQQDRYALLSQYLRSVSAPGLVEFAYLAQGIRVRSQWYPVVKMEWVDGLTLQTYVAQHVQDGAKLRNLALQWRGLIDRLRQNSVAHCDLQHGNVLVTPREKLQLVDYDGMYVPPLKGKSSHELGHPNYQHPRRSPTDYDETLDNFSALVIYTAVRALVAEPALWTRFDTGENLLFSASDYKAPAQSALFQRLEKSPDPAVRTLATRIAQVCGGTVAQTPDFRRTVENLPPIAEPEPWWREYQPAPTSPATAPRVPPLPKKATPHPGKSAQKPAPDATLPWWKKPPSSTFSGLSRPDWLAPSVVVQFLQSRFQARNVRSKRSKAPTIVAQILHSRISTLPMRQTLWRGSGCLAIIGLSCLVAIICTAGLTMALQLLFQQVFGGTGATPSDHATPPAANAKSAPSHKP
jgi:hypothetical protein